MWYISDTFSLDMIPKKTSYKIFDLGFEPDFIGFEYKMKSIIGNPDIARVLKIIGNFKLECNKEIPVLGFDDILYVAHYQGPPLIEGATQLPEGASFRWFEIRF